MNGLEEAILGKKELASRAENSTTLSQYIHVYLRVATAHAESETLSNSKRRKIRDELDMQPICKSLEGMKSVRDRLREEIKKRNLTLWIDTDAEHWISRLEEPDRNPSP